MLDFVTHEELTEENFIRCLNGYLSTVKLIDKDKMEILLLYIDTALTVGGADLTKAVIGVITEDLIHRYD